MTKCTGQHLVFTLEGPFASWGEIAVGVTRPSGNRPTRSALIGLIAACLGVKREDSDGLSRLSNLIFATRLDNAGTLLHDYHTVQAPSKKSGVRYRTRHDEITWNKTKSLNTILTSRAYRTDFAATVVACLSRNGATGEITLSDISDALREPVFAPYLGRKACILAQPMDPEIIVAADFREAANAYDKLRTSGGSARAEVEIGQGVSPEHWFWEEGYPSSIEHGQKNTRHDMRTSDKVRSFKPRVELEALIDK